MSDVFRVQSDRAQGVKPQPQPSRPVQQNASTSFGETLAQVQEVRFSNHAQKRLQTREIALSDDSVNRLVGAIDKAEKRGGKSSLVVVDDLAFIVNVRDRLVVTALDDVHRGEGVFTQIDSVVFADPADSAALRVDKKG